MMSGGASYAQVVQMIGPPPSQSPFGGFGQTGGANPMQTGGGVNPMQQLLYALLGPTAIGATQAPYNLQMQAANIGMNPAALTSRINQATRQLSPELIHSVTRATTPSIASRGLATSPGMSQQMIAEALAPYQLKEQQMAQQTVMGGMQYPFNVGGGLAGQYPSSLIDYATLLGAPTGP
jgi:hypothetical protein